jgi:hypothetical protein
MEVLETKTMELCSTRNANSCSAPQEIPRITVMSKILFRNLPRETGKDVKFPSRWTVSGTRLEMRATHSTATFVIVIVT